MKRRIIGVIAIIVFFGIQVLFSRRGCPRQLSRCLVDTCAHCVDNLMSVSVPVSASDRGVTNDQTLVSSI